MPLCDPEEVETRLLVHVRHAVKSNAKTGVIRTVDTDMIGITLARFHSVLLLLPRLQIWITFGMGKHYQHLSVKRMYRSLGRSKVMALPMIHAITGSDTTSTLQGRGKKSAWEAWDVSPDVMDAFLEVINNPFVPLTIDSPKFAANKRFVVIMYDKTNAGGCVNTIPWELFTKRARELENIPPTTVSSNLLFWLSFLTP